MNVEGSEAAPCTRGAAFFREKVEEREQSAAVRGVVACEPVKSFGHMMTRPVDGGLSPDRFGHVSCNALQAQRQFAVKN